MLTVVKSKPVCSPLSIYPVPAFPPFTCRLLLTIRCWPAGPTQLQVLLQGQFAVCNERYTYTCVYLWPSVRVCMTMDWQRVCAFVLSCLDMDTARERSETGANCSRQRDLLWLHHSTGQGSSSGHHHHRPSPFPCPCSRCWHIACRGRCTSERCLLLKHSSLHIWTCP